MVRQNRQWILTTRPTGSVGRRHFDFRTVAVPDPGPGEALVRVVWLGIDPTQRSWLNEDPSYISAVRVGEVMRGSGVGQVVASRTEELQVGDWVAGMLGWQDYALASGPGLFGVNRVPEGVDPKAMLSVFGTTGLTAYFGMTDIGGPATGETVFVSGAAGSTGSIAGQIAKIAGCRVIGAAGGPEKCAWVTGTAGFDACIDYKREDTAARLRELAPNGINVAFDTVGGPMLEAALDSITERARVVLCGEISSGYNGTPPSTGPRNYGRLCLTRGRMEGFVFLDYVARFPEAFEALGTWLSEGRLAYREDVRDGLENAPEALQGLFEGRNLGKQLVRVAEPRPA